MTLIREQTYMDLEQSVFKADLALFRSASQHIDDPAAAFLSLTRGLDKARKHLGDHRSSVAEFLQCVDVMREGLEQVKAARPADPGQPVVVIGVVQGDVHDLGKNIVAGVLEAYGCRVVDLDGMSPPWNLWMPPKNKARRFWPFPP